MLAQERYCGGPFLRRTDGLLSLFCCAHTSVLRGKHSNQLWPGTSIPVHLQPHSTCCQELTWQLVELTLAVQLGESPAFLSPICLSATWGATSLIICGGCLLAAAFLPPLLLLPKPQSHHKNQ